VNLDPRGQGARRQVVGGRHPDGDELVETPANRANRSAIAEASSSDDASSTTMLSSKFGMCPGPSTVISLITTAE